MIFILFILLFGFSDVYPSHLSIFLYALHLYYSTVDLFDFIINNCDFDRSMKARWTASFGKSYDYNGMSYPAIPFPDNFTNILNSINDTIGFHPNNCLINLYHDGKSSMGYHSDNTDILTPRTGVVIISLGSDRILRFKNKLDGSIIVDYTLTQKQLQ